MKYAALLPRLPIAASVTEYAAGFGQDFYRVFREVPYALVLIGVFCLKDRERVLDLYEQGARLESAVFASYAHHDPQQITKEQGRHIRRLRANPATGEVPKPEALTDALRQIQEARARTL